MAALPRSSLRGWGAVHGGPAWNLHPSLWALPTFALGLAVIAWALSAGEDTPRRLGLLAGVGLALLGGVSALATG